MRNRWKKGNVKCTLGLRSGTLALLGRRLDPIQLDTVGIDQRFCPEESSNFECCESANTNSPWESEQPKLYRLLCRCTVIIERFITGHQTVGVLVGSLRNQHHNPSPQWQSGGVGSRTLALGMTVAELEWRVATASRFACTQHIKVFCTEYSIPT